MGVLFKIAYRNLKEHKTKTLIIGIIIAFGVFILVIGNSLIDTAAAGIRKNYSGNYTGDIIITSDKQDQPRLFFSGGGGSSFDKPIPVIPDYRKVFQYVQSFPGVTAVNPQLSGFAIVQVGENGKGFLQLWAVDPAMYRAMFPGNLKIIKGSFLGTGEEGIVVSKEVADGIHEETGKSVMPGDKLLITSMNAVSGTKVREVTVRGVYDFVNSSPQLDLISFIDTGTMRILNGMTRIQNVAAELTKKEQSDLGTVDENSLFSEDGGDQGSSGLVTVVTPAREGTAVNEKALDSILGDTSKRDLLNETDPNSWHFLLAKTENPREAERMIREMNSYFAANDIAVKAFDWKAGAGGIAEMTATMKMIFNILILIVAIVAVIIVMNTLVISVTERMGEIGTMRAIGAQRGFVRFMIILETVLISAAFGLIGIAAGSGVIALLGATGIQATNIFLQVLFGGPVLHPVISASSLVSSLIMVMLVGILSSLYPVAVALKISPVQAMNRTA